MTAWKEKIQSIIAQEDLEVSEIKSQLQQLIVVKNPVLKVKTLNDVRDKLLRCMPGQEDNLISIGFKELEQTSGGFSKGEITVIAGRPGMGSSRMLNHIILQCAEKHKCLVINLQHASEKTWLELLTYQLDKDYNLSSRNGDLLKEIFTDEFQQKHEKVTANISVCDRVSLDIDEFETQLRAQIKTNEIEVLCIDKVQNLGRNSEFRQRNHELTIVMRMLKRIAEELNICIFLNSSVSRSVERRHVKIPTLTDLSESNAIEEYADKVLLLYRPQYYETGNEFYNDKNDNIMEVHVAKNRHGITYVSFMHFMPVFQEFTNNYETVPFAFEEKRLDEIFDIIRKGVEKNIQEDDEPVF
jgi:replicative DNA helicase